MTITRTRNTNINSSEGKKSELFVNLYVKRNGELLPLCFRGVIVDDFQERKEVLANGDEAQELKNQASNYFSQRIQEKIAETPKGEYVELPEIVAVGYHYDESKGISKKRISENPYINNSQDKIA